MPSYTYLKMEIGYGLLTLRYADFERLVVRTTARFSWCLLKSSWFKGRIGEWLVNRAIKRTLPKRDYHLFKDVTLSTEDGTTQIDHIIVSKFGVCFGNQEYARLDTWILQSKNVDSENLQAQQQVPESATSEL